MGLSSGRLMCTSQSLDNGTRTRGLSGVGYGTFHIKWEMNLENEEKFLRYNDVIRETL